MSTEIKTQLKSKTIAQFWGGDERGAMLQITGDYGYVQFDLQEATEIIKIFTDFVAQEAKRRQELLKKKIQNLKGLEKTVFNEIVNLDNNFLNFDVKLMAVTLISKYTPIVED